MRGENYRCVGSTSLTFSCIDIWLQMFIRNLNRVPGFLSIEGFKRRKRIIFSQKHAMCLYAVNILYFLLNDFCFVDVRYKKENKTVGFPLFYYDWTCIKFRNLNIVIEPQYLRITLIMSKPSDTNIGDY